LNKRSSPSSGFTLFEIIIALFIISIAVIPMMKSFGPAMSTAAIVEKTAVLSNQARATMERLLILDFDTLKEKIDDSPFLGNDIIFGAVDETFTFKEVFYTPSITITDASGDASKTLLDVTVALDSMSISTRKADY